MYTLNVQIKITKTFKKLFRIIRVLVYKYFYDIGITYNIIYIKNVGKIIQSCDCLYTKHDFKSKNNESSTLSCLNTK